MTKDVEMKKEKGASTTAAVAAEAANPNNAQANKQPPTAAASKDEGKNSKLVTDNKDAGANTSTKPVASSPANSNKNDKTSAVITQTAANSSSAAAATTGGDSNRRGRSSKKSSASATSYQPHRALSKMQSQQVDAAFQELFGYPWGTVFCWNSSSQTAATATSNEPGELTSEQVMLGKVLGKRRAAQLFHLHPSTRIPTATAKLSTTTKERVIRKQQTYKHKIDTSTAPSTSSTTSNNSSSKTKATAAVGSGGGGGTGGGMDQLLDKMSQSNKLTTTAKTAADWETFKDTAGPGLGDKLEEHAESKGAYLKRQDFLNRVDHRQFEKERAQREQTRAARDR